MLYKGRMKKAILPLTAFLLAGCTTYKPASARLDSAGATALARKLANGKADQLYHCRPFTGGPEARRADGAWIWKDIKAHGLGDMEGAVTIPINGDKPLVTVLLLDNRTMLMRTIR